jgi:hypothetical protein
VRRESLAARLKSLAAASPSTANRVGLAHSLRPEGDAFCEAARSSSGMESIDAYQHGHDCYFETLKILDSLKQSGKRPSAHRQSRRRRRAPE